MEDKKPIDSKAKTVEIEVDCAYTNAETGKHIYRAFSKGEKLTVDPAQKFDFDEKGKTISTNFVKVLKFNGHIK